MTTVCDGNGNSLSVSVLWGGWCGAVLRAARSIALDGQELCF